MPDIIQNIDWSILHAIQAAIGCEFSDAFFPIVTALGDAGFIWILAALVLLCIPKTRRIGVNMALGLVFALLVGNILLKPLVARDRPCWLDPSFPLLVEIPDDYSFPSGHTLASFAAAVSVFIHHKGFGAGAIALAAVIAFSRLYLYVHFPSDVLAGMLLGIIGAVVAWLIARKLPEKLLISPVRFFKERKQPQEK